MVAMDSVPDTANITTVPGGGKALELRPLHAAGYADPIAIPLSDYRLLPE